MKNKRRWKDFLSMSVEERNLAVGLSLNIKKELKQHFTLKELGLRDSWDNIDIKALLSLPLEHLAKMKSQKHIGSKSRIFRDLKQLYSLMGSNKSIPEGELTLNSWLNTR
ncbi:MAG: hypothetical protein H3Z52_03640 [archaeon]|nr:hypothetical protein [archaeon]